MRETTTRKPALIVWTLALIVFSSTWAAGGTEPVQRTFQPKNLGVVETANMIGEMTGLEAVAVNEKAGTIVIEAPPETLSQVEFLLRVFDTERSKDESPWEIRVFHLKRVSTREAITLLRAKLQVLEIAENAARDRVAVRDSVERLDAAAKLLEEAERAGD